MFYNMRFVLRYIFYINTIYIWLTSCTFLTVCDTLGIQVFLRFSGELVSYEKLGQLDLIKVL